MDKHKAIEVTCENSFTLPRRKGFRVKWQAYTSSPTLERCEMKINEWYCSSAQDWKIQIHSASDTSKYYRVINAVNGKISDKIVRNSNGRWQFGKHYYVDKDGNRVDDPDAAPCDDTPIDTAPADDPISESAEVDAVNDDANNAIEVNAQTESIDPVAAEVNQPESPATDTPDKAVGLKQNFNTFNGKAPKTDWIRDFFRNPDAFMKENTLGTSQIAVMKRFLFDAELLHRKAKITTALTALIREIGWQTPTVWGLILNNLVYNNSQMRWYVKNLPVNVEFTRAAVEEKLSIDGVNVRDSKAISLTFKHICEMQLGTELNFGATTVDERNNLSTLKRTKARVDDGRVILYALYRFAEATGGLYQFTLTRLMNDADSAGVSPTTIFGIDREEMQRFLNGLSVNYPDFVNATFTHDLEKISLNTEKTSRDVMNLFAGNDTTNDPAHTDTALTVNTVDDTPTVDTASDAENDKADIDFFDDDDSDASAGFDLTIEMNDAPFEDTFFAAVAEIPAADPVEGITDNTEQSLPMGAECTLKTDNGSAVRVVYSVKAIDDVIASHRFTGSSVCVNMAYPAEFQPRNRESVVLQTQVYKMARGLDPTMLTASVNLNQGAPIVRADGVVLNGNGRVMAIALAYSQGYDSGKGYRQHLIEHAADFGLTAESVETIDQPVLVRVIADELDSGTLDSVIHSTIGGSDMSGLETAIADAARLKIADFADYDDDSEGDLTNARNTGFVGKIIYRLAKDNERARYYLDNGALSKDAVERVKRALFALAYNDDGLLEKMTASTDEGAKNISNALISVAPNFAKLALQTAIGVYHKYDFAATLATAVKRYEYVRGSEYPSVEHYFRQGTMFDRESPTVEHIMRFFDANKRNQKWIKAFLMHIIDVIKRQGAPVEITLGDFAQSSPLTLDEVVLTAIKHTNEAKGGGIDLFIAEASDDRVAADSSNTAVDTLDREFQQLTEGAEADEAVDANQSAPPSDTSTADNAPVDNAAVYYADKEGISDPTGLYPTSTAALNQMAPRERILARIGVGCIGTEYIKVTQADNGKLRFFYCKPKGINSYSCRAISEEKAYTLVRCGYASFVDYQPITVWDELLQLFILVDSNNRVQVFDANKNTDYRAGRLSRAFRGKYYDPDRDDDHINFYHGFLSEFNFAEADCGEFIKTPAKIAYERLGFNTKDLSIESINEVVSKFYAIVDKISRTDKPAVNDDSAANDTPIIDTADAANDNPADYSSADTAVDNTAWAFDLTFDLRAEPRVNFCTDPVDTLSIAPAIRLFDKPAPVDPVDNTDKPIVPVVNAVIDLPTAASQLSDGELLDTLETAAFTLAAPHSAGYQPAIDARDAMVYEIAFNRLHLFNEGRERLVKGAQNGADYKTAPFAPPVFDTPIAPPHIVDPTMALVIYKPPMGERTVDADKPIEVSSDAVLITPPPKPHVNFYAAPTMPLAIEPAIKLLTPPPAVSVDDSAIDTADNSNVGETAPDIGNTIDAFNQWASDFIEGIMQWACDNGSLATVDAITRVKIENNAAELNAVFDGISRAEELDNAVVVYPPRAARMAPAPTVKKAKGVGRRRVKAVETPPAPTPVKAIEPPSTPEPPHFKTVYTRNGYMTFDRRHTFNLRAAMQRIADEWDE